MYKTHEINRKFEIKLYFTCENQLLYLIIFSCDKRIHKNIASGFQLVKYFFDISLKERNIIYIFLLFYTS